VEQLVELGQAAFTARVLFTFPRPADTSSPSVERLRVAGRDIALALVVNPRARRYVLRLRPDGSARVTIPRGGSRSAGRRFAEGHEPWLARQLERLANRPAQPAPWRLGTEVFLRGERRIIEAAAGSDGNAIQLGDEVISVRGSAADWRPVIERHLWRLAIRELPPRVWELAASHQLTVRRITVRNQRTRWGSCSRRATISLNWRLVQTPPFVRDYIILHELCHLREMNHSARFWRAVGRVCPDFAAAERWLKQHAALLR
jgi:predicted metal-dependent hydrolase